MFEKFIKWLFNTGRVDLLNLPLTSTDVEFNIIAGIWYSLTENDASDIDKFTRHRAYFLDDFQAFNQTIKEDYFWGKLIERRVVPLEFKAGKTFYLPSTNEVILHTFSNQFSDKDEAINQFLIFQNTEEDKILKTAIKRATGLIGAHYGTDSLIFLSPNEQLVGASENNIKFINDEKQYEINWGADIWKCNIFLHDVVYDAGFEPDVMDNQHYITAGQLHQSKKFEELEIKEVMPGNLVQLFSGQGENQSHNLVLTSFVKRGTKSNGNQLWQFKALGAEQDRAAISFRKYEVTLIDDSYKILGARFEQIRFFKPKFKRDEILV